MGKMNQYNELFEEVLSGRLSRRAVMRRALALGLSLPAISALLAACGDDDEEEPTATTGGGGAAATATEGGGEAEATATEGEAMATETMGGETEATATEGGAVASPTEEEATGSPTGSPGGGEEMTADNPPDVENADEASQYSGVNIVFWGDAVGPGSEADEALAAKFTEQTGINVEVVPRPQSATESYAQYQRIFQAQSGDMDAGMVDVIWPGAFAQHLADLSDAMSDRIDRYYETIVENNTVDGKLVGIPWFGDFGILYYRTDLQEKYGFDAPPATWDELEEQARTIMEGERGEGNNEFTGFVFQGNAYEGLTCDALEWIASQGGGNIVEDGEVTLDNEQAIAALNRAQAWVGDIAPQGVTTYQEEDARNVYQAGNSAFMRNWPYAYSAGKSADSPVADTLEVAPLPSAEGENSVGTVGGWQIAVNSYSENIEAATEWAKYITSAPVQKWRAIVYSFVPTMPEVAEDPQVIESMPFLATMSDVVRVTRPSRETGDQYNEFSTIFFQGCNEILNGSAAEDVVPDMADELADLL